MVVVLEGHLQVQSRELRHVPGRELRDRGIEPSAMSGSFVWLDSERAQNGGCSVGLPSPQQNGASERNRHHTFSESPGQEPLWWRFCSAPLAEGTEPQRKTSHAQIWISVDWGISGDSFYVHPALSGCSVLQFIARRVCP